MTNQPTFTCDTALNVLQDRLDGNAQPVEPAVAVHLRQCVECRSRFAAADVLLAAFATRVTPDITVRINTAVYLDGRRRTRRRWLIAATGLAAAIVLALRLIIEPPPPDTVVAKNVPSIERRIGSAKDALWSWGGQTVGIIGIPSLPDTTVDFVRVEQAVEPATNVLTDAGKGLVDGLEPFTSSAKRATKRFWRDLPTN